VRTAAAVIITHNSEEVVEGCVAALAKFAPHVEAIVVDNASVDRTVGLARRSGARVLANTSNRGFAAAANQGIASTSAELVLVMNPDATVTTPLDPMFAACAGHGLAGAQLTDAAGSPQPGLTRRFPTPMVLALELLGLNRLFPWNPWNRKYRYLSRDPRQDGPVDQPPGAFLMIRRDVWQALGGFDEDFWPIWFEDVDFCRRATSAGYSGQYAAGVQVSHQGGHSIRQVPSSSREMYWYVNLIKYAAKHFSTGAYRSLCLAAVVGTVPRMILGIVQERDLRPLISNFKIIDYLGRRLVSNPHRVGRGTQKQ